MSAEQSALVSVIIPCYNQAQYLGEAIESVLNQTYPHFEIVVVDDGSPDDTSEVAARYPQVRCVRQENQGLPRARNAGFRVSKGEYLIFLDADDRLLPNALGVGVESLNAHPKSGYVAGRVRYIASDGSPMSAVYDICTERPEDHYLWLLCFNHTWTPAAVMFRRSAFEAVGGYKASSRFKGSEDYDICLRIASRSPAHCHNEVTAQYRLHESGMSRDLGLILKGATNVLRSQRKLVKGDKRREEAYSTGVRRIQEGYGDQIAEQIGARVRSRSGRKEVMNSILVLARYYPQGLVKHAFRKFRRAVTRSGDSAG